MSTDRKLIPASHVAKVLNCNSEFSLWVNNKFDAAEYFMFYAGFIEYRCDDVNFVSKFDRLDRTKFHIHKVDVYVKSENNSNIQQTKHNVYFAWYEPLTENEISRLGSYCPCQNCTSPNYFSMSYWFPITYSSGCLKCVISKPDVKTSYLCKLYLQKKNMC
jgi:hypothetical protein